MSMAINPIGLISALVVFFGIWASHLAVRKVEAIAARLWIPMAIFAASGIVLELVATRLSDRSLSMTCGIVGMILLWDVLEFKRQARRVQIGHAPANRANPRHAAMLENFPLPTTTQAFTGDNFLLEKANSIDKEQGP